MATPIDIIIRAQDAFSTVTQKFRSEVNAMAKASEGLKSALNIAATATIAGTAILALTKQVADYGEAINKASIQTGLTAEQISGLKFALEQSETSLESFIAGFRIYAKQLQETEGPQANVYQGLLRTVDQFSALEGATARATFAVKNFGRGGLDLIPFLSEGRDGIEKLTAKAEELGLVIDGKVAKASDTFNDSVAALTGSIKGLAISIASPLLPYLTDLVNLLIKGAEAGNAFATAMTKPGAAIQRFTAPELPKLPAAPAIPGQDIIAMGRAISPRSDMEILRQAVAEQLEARAKADAEALKAAKDLADAKVYLENYAYEAALEHQHVLRQERLAAAAEEEDLANKKEYLENYAYEAALEHQHVLQREAEQLAAAQERMAQATEDIQMSIAEAEGKLREERERQQKKSIESIRNAAGHIFDDMFTRGKNVFESLASLFKSLFATVTRTLFQDLAQMLLTGQGGLGSKLGGLIGLGRTAGGIVTPPFVPGGKTGGLLGGLGGLGGILGSGAPGSIGTINPATGVLVPGATGIGGALGLGGGAGLFGLGAATIPVLGGIAAGVFGLYKLFSHRQTEAPFSRDPVEQRSVEYFYNTMPATLDRLGRAVDTFTRKYTPVPAKTVIMSGMPDALQTSSQFRRDMNGVLQNDQ